MLTELVVDTALLRSAANVVEDAATSFASAGGRALSCRLTDDSLGRSAVAREVVEASARRVLHVLQACRMAAGTASGTAAHLRTVAAVFEFLESIPGPHR